MYPYRSIENSILCRNLIQSGGVYIGPMKPRHHNGRCYLSEHEPCGKSDNKRNMIINSRVRFVVSGFLFTKIFHLGGKTMDEKIFTSESVTEGHPDKFVMPFLMQFWTLAWQATPERVACEQLT